MKTEIALIALLALAGTTLFFTTGNQAPVSLEASNSDVFQKYVVWKAKFNKNTNSNEDQYRFAIFQDNLKIIKQHNSKKSQLTLGLTQFADLTLEEFKSQMISQITPFDIQTNVQKSQVNVNAPETLDWVSKGAVAPIQNQGNCGSCWAFSAVSQLEGLNQINSGNLVKFSEQQLTSCVPFPLSLGCNGGNFSSAFLYVANTDGITTEENYPYAQETNPKTAACDASSVKAPLFKNEGLGVVAPNSPSDIQNQLVNQPLSIAVAAGNVYFQLYNGGVIDNEKCGNALDHAISLTGYDFSGSNNYWTVRNSWGASWGNGGYANIARSEGDGICGMNMNVSYPTQAQ